MTLSSLHPRPLPRPRAPTQRPPESLYHHYRRRHQLLLNQLPHVIRLLVDRCSRRVFYEFGVLLHGNEQYVTTQVMTTIDDMIRPILGHEAEDTRFH